MYTTDSVHSSNADNASKNIEDPCISLIHIPYPVLKHDNHQREAAASTAPAALNVALFVILTSTGYIRSIYFAQPAYQLVTILQ